MGVWCRPLMLFTPILSYLPGVRGQLAHPLGGEKVHWTFSGFRLAPHEGGRDVLFWYLFRDSLGLHRLVKSDHPAQQGFARNVFIAHVPQQLRQFLG